MNGYLSEVGGVLSAVDPTEVDALVDMLWRAWERDATVFSCGNGGSATTSNHMALDLSKQTMVPGRRALRAVSLSSNVGPVTAWANDSDFSRVYAEQLLAHARPGDVVVCISCSGNSSNITAVLAEAERLGLQTAGLGGFSGGQLRQESDVYVHVPSDDYGVVESVHLAIEHCLSAMLHERAVAPRRGAIDKPVVMVDRDGVINRNLEDGVRRWEDFEFLPGSLQALTLLALHGHRVVVVSNQASVGRGGLTPAQLADINRRMSAEVLAHGGSIEAIYVCQHSPEAACACRKPAPGLLLRASQELGFDIGDAYFVGDHATDVQAAIAAGARPVLVLSGRGDAEHELRPQFVAGDLLEAADVIVTRHNEFSDSLGVTVADKVG